MENKQLTPEQQARVAIDRKLVQAGRVIQDKQRLNLYAGLGVAVREMDTDTGPADYMLFIDGKACGIIEAKKEGADLGGVAGQSQRYAVSGLRYIQRAAANDQPLPFLYEATSQEIRFRDQRDPYPRSRFHRPETFKDWLEEEGDVGWADAGSSTNSITLRGRLQHLPKLDTQNLRTCQISAIHGVEESLKAAKPRALPQMGERRVKEPRTPAQGCAGWATREAGLRSEVTGSGKTYTAVTQVYRLAKFAKIKRALFLVDRGNLATNAKDEFEQFVIPHDGRKFIQHYNVNILGRAGIPDATKVTISTIRLLYSQLTVQELDDEADEYSGFEVEASTVNKEPRPVSYNPDIPIEAFDVIIIDECHCSIYNLWRQVLDKFAGSKFARTSVHREAGSAMDGAQQHFDAFLIGLTATPTKKTIGFFGQNLVSEYTFQIMKNFQLPGTKTYDQSCKEWRILKVSYLQQSELSIAKNGMKMQLDSMFWIVSNHNIE